MQKSKIEWTDFTINPVKGLCPMACEYCYARRHYQRFHLKKDGSINPTWDYIIRYQKGWEYSLPVKPSKIFVGSTMELFGDWIKLVWIQDIIQIAGANPQHTFIFLTKQPHNLIKYSPFPENCWIGVSTTGNDCRSGLEDIFASIQATVKFVSIEPLKDYTPMDFRWVDWVIIGCETKNGKPVKENLPQISWIKDIIKDCDALGKPVFLKNNLMSVLPFDPIFREKDKHGVSMSFLRQEFPEVKVGVK